jgi:hypothetical protein
MKLAHAKLEEKKKVKDLRAPSELNSKPDSRRHCNQPEKVEPTCDPGRERCTLWLGYHGRPKIRTTTGRMRTANL